MTRREVLVSRLDPAALDGGTGVFSFAFDAEAVTVRVADGVARVEDAVAPDADVRVRATGADWDAIVAGTLDLQLAHRTGRLHVDGDMALAQRVRALLGF